MYITPGKPLVHLVSSFFAFVHDISITEVCPSVIIMGYPNAKVSNSASLTFANVEKEEVWSIAEILRQEKMET